MPSEASPLLSVSNLSARIGGQVVLHDISFRLAQRDWLAVVGGSGTGKSTLLRAIMGLRRPARPTQGHLNFDGRGHDLTQRGAQRPSGIALVPQSPAHGLDPLRRLHWQWLQLARLKTGQATMTGAHRALFSALGLPGPGQSWPHEWSRGMQQRLLLAMALMEQPKLLVLDEPTSALDPLIAAQVLGEVQAVAREQGIAVMMVTHDLGLAARFSNQLAIMEAGRLVEAGPTAGLLDAPQHPATRDLVAHRHWLRASDTALAAE